MMSTPWLVLEASSLAEAEPVREWLLARDVVELSERVTGHPMDDWQRAMVFGMAWSA
jgi:hypothetical protein